MLKTKYLLPLILILLLTFTLIANCAWLSGYDQRIKLTIDNTKVDAALSNFPITIFFTSTQGEEIFNEFDADTDYMECAFTSSDGTTQLYAEKELFTLNTVSQYPTAQSDTYVKSTTKAGTSNWAYYTTDPTKSLTGGTANNQWYSANSSVTNQRFHIDLGSAKIVKRIYYENSHSAGTEIDRGVQNFTFWGSNTGAGTFDDLVYANDEGWTQLTISQSTFDQHAASDAADPKYITVTNTTAYRYYAFKFADNYGDNEFMGVRRIELQAGGAIYHVKVPSVASGADTDIYYYYDNDHADNTTYIGAINTTAGGHVWDSNFEAVYHMIDTTTSTVADSTSNNNDGTKKAANEPIEASGKVGQGQDFDGSDDTIDCGDGVSLDITAAVTVEAIFESDVIDLLAQIAGRDDGTNRNYYLDIDTAEIATLVIFDSNSAYQSKTSTNFVADTTYYVAGTYDGDTITMYQDGTQDGTPTAHTGTIDNDDVSFSIGTREDGADRKFNGMLDEIRVSSTARNAAWIKATYNTLYDTLLTYGSEETAGVITNIMFLFSNF